MNDRLDGWLAGFRELTSFGSRFSSSRLTLPYFGVLTFNITDFQISSCMRRENRKRRARTVFSISAC